ncbi:MAG: hypothetical protein ACI9W6_003128 [Motiliproteus sp.]|jgi:hypothetical protein
MVNFWTLYDGMATRAGLIIAIGSQNAFVLRQGLRHEVAGPDVDDRSWFDELNADATRACGSDFCEQALPAPYGLSTLSTSL